MKPMSNPAGAAGWMLLTGLLAIAILGPAARAETSTAPPETLGGQRVVEIVAGFEHTCARVQTGAVWCWGRNTHGQLGDGTTTHSATPRQVPGLTGITQLALGRSHTCALRSNGRIACWGRGSDGQLGNGATGTSRQPVEVSGVANATQIAAGYYHNCALRSNGRAVCWGWNGHGQLGDGTTTNRATPVAVAGRLATRVTGIGAGSRHSCLLRSTGRVACWGSDDYGMLGNGSVTGVQRLPVSVISLSGVATLVTGDYHTCATRGTGRVSCWGWNGHGGLGDGTRVNRDAPVRVRNLLSPVQVAAGGWDGHSCALRDGGQILCWGWNEYGTLGDGTTTDRLTPRRIPRVADATQVSTGGYHSCALRGDGRPYCWGRNTYGQLGDGTTTTRLTPTPVAN